MTVAVLGVFSAMGAEEEDENLAKALRNGIGLTKTIVQMTDEEIAEYKKSTDDFTVQAVEAWESSVEDLGAWVPDAENAEPTVTVKGHTYTVTVPQTFEKAKANFVYLFDKRANPTTLTLDVKLPMGLTIVRALLNTLVGIGIVFLVLAFLSFVISLLKFVPALLEQGTTKAPAPAPAPVRAAAPVTAPAEEELADDEELVAVIAAAVAASENISPDGFVVRSIRKANRRAR
ncbi:MAG: OadG family protein [Blautia sp.]|nr:OadG family protein [Blautia sp.]